MSITTIIIVITVLVSIMSWNRPTLFQLLLFNPFLISSKGQYFRFLSSGFIHGSWIHLGFNMFTLYFFGSNIEYIYERTTGTPDVGLFLGLYLGGIVISDIPNFFKHRHNPGYSALGASGGVSAVVFASILFMPISPICLYGIICIPGFILGVLYIIYSVYQGKTMSDNINHQAHLIGATYGVLYSLWVSPSALGSFIDQISRYQIF